MAKITTVLFDYDGTLMDTDDLIIDAWQYTYRQMTGEELSVKEILSSFGEALHFTMSKYFSGEDLEKAIQIHHDHQTATYLERIGMFGGMKELVLELKEKGYQVGVVTSRRKGSTMLGLEKYQLTDVFDVIVTADDTEKHKPEPEPVLYALRALDRTAEETVLVGDTIMDIGCGQAAGVKTVWCTWAIAAKTETRSMNPDHRINAAGEFWSVLEALDAE